MTSPLASVKKKFGRCFIEKSERSLDLDLRQAYTVISEQVGYVVISFLASLKSNEAGWLSKPVYLENLHIYHVYEDEADVKNMLV